MSEWISVEDRLPLDMNDKEVVSPAHPYVTVNVVVCYIIGLIGYVECHTYVVGCSTFCGAKLNR